MKKDVKFLKNKKKSCLKLKIKSIRNELILIRVIITNNLFLNNIKLFLILF